MGLSEETIRKVMKEEMQEVTKEVQEVTKEVHAVSLRQHAIEADLQEVAKEVQEVAKKMAKEVQEVAKEVHSVSLRQHIMNEKLPKITDVRITPSEYKKSIHKDVFMDVMEVVGFGREKMTQRITKFEGTSIGRSAELDLSYNWMKGQSESQSYEPLMKHLNDHDINIVCVDGGQGLPDGLLYNEEIWTLKKNTSLRSEELRKTSSEPIFKYIISGRTDLVRIRYKDEALGKNNNRYFIEIKRVEDFVQEESLREAVLQLIGGNASNSFHSPPVVLTNLAKMHFVLFITLEGDPTLELKFKLSILKMRTFGDAIAFAEEKTTTFQSVTLHLGRKPTPQASPLKDQTSTEASDDIEVITESFSSVTVHNAITDDNSDAF